MFDLTVLPKKDLNELFIKVNSDYINECKGDPHDYMKKEHFLKISSQLNAILNELQRRREQT